MQLKKRSGQKPYLTLPGGKQDPGETLAQCVVRECAEEIGAKVRVGPLLHVAELFQKKDAGRLHRLEFLFLCTVADGYDPKLGPAPDPSQIGTIWASLDTPPARFKPDYRTILAAKDAPQYLGLLDE